ncbi:ribonuclease III [Nostoc sp. FACHB-87]|uniref:ribonuclease III n=1 Tax=Nostocaceae TaxID=1162 RepID=UPI0016829176|nr:MULTISPECIES: ribonuclease III [Nostocaceae]MBD2297611.1 ribonuclease III [Nostoc sp. FACHB-190]MBD2453861.1 ribonuclease III [Nostoc sp. FACHB-87]MBD2475984.1 ribonuclease III [Anabaena sp. FACHB-83]
MTIIQIKYFTFDDEKYLIQALTHRSYVNEHPGEEHNERLEFLGDAILNFLSGEYLYHEYEDKGEDELTRRRSALVDEKQLEKFAIDIGIKKEIRLGQGAIRDGGRDNPNLLSSAFEAVVGAYYIDKKCNIDEVRKVIKQIFKSVPEQIFVIRSNVDSKNRLQEWVHSQHIPTPPKYETSPVPGLPDHAPEFTAKVFVEGYEELLDEIRGKGRNKKEAEKDAAEKVLKWLEEQGWR